MPDDKTTTLTVVGRRDKTIGEVTGFKKCHTTNNQVDSKVKKGVTKTTMEATMRIDRRRDGSNTNVNSCYFSKELTSLLTTQIRMCLQKHSSFRQ